MSATTRLCPTCGTPLPSDAPKGLCPECLLRGGFESAGTGGTTQPAGDPRQRTIHIVVPVDEPAGGVPETLRYFGDYELLEQIAAGGMGVVFKARQVSLNRTVAVKMIRAGHLAREDDIRRFRTEAEAAANLKHPHIVAIHEIGEHRGQHYFSMDFIEGCSLADLVRDRPLEPARAARLAQTIAEAIAYAHQRGVLHRDLKPSNVMMDAQGQPHVTDFGLAKLFDVAQASPPASLGGVSAARSDSRRGRPENPQARTPAPPDHTQTGAIMGSPSYMSPEQARGRGDRVSVRSDVYALGTMLYELLTTHPPFLAATALETIQMVVDREPVAPRALNPSVPRDLETIALKCLAKEPSARYATAQELADELARYLNGEPIHARPVSATVRVWRWCRRKPALAGALATAALLFLLGAAGVLWQWRRAEQNTRLADQRLYAADMSLALQKLTDGRFSEARELVRSHRRQSNYHDFVWHYLEARTQGEALATLRGHRSPVVDLAFSPDGRWLASRDKADSLKLWDVAACRDRLTLTNVQSIAGFLPDGANLVMGLRPDTVAVCDGATALPRPLIEGAGIPFAVLADGHTVAATTTNFLVKLWDLRRGQATRELPGRGGVSEGDSDYDVARVAISADGKRLVVRDGAMRSSIPGSLSVWDLEKMERLAQFSETLPCYSMRLSTNGSQLIVGRIDGWLRWWNVDEPEREARLVAAHGATVSALAFLPDLSVATASSDQAVKLWNQDAATPSKVLGGHQAPVRAVAASPDGKLLASGDVAGEVNIWPITWAPERITIEGVVAGIADPIHFSPDGRHLAVMRRVGRSRVLIEVLETDTLTTETSIAQGAGLFGFSADGRQLIVGLNPLRRWDLAQEKITDVTPLELPAPTQGKAASLAVFSPNGGFVAIAFQEPMVWIGDAASSKEAAFLRDLLNPVRQLLFSPDGRTLMTEDRNGVRVWQLPQGRLLSRYVLSHSERRPLTLSSDGRVLAESSRSGMSLMNAATFEPMFFRRGQVSHAMAFSPDGRTLALAGYGAVRLWNVAVQQEVGSLAFFDRPEPGQVPRLQQVAFSPDGSLLAARNSMGVLRLWRIGRPTPRAEAPSHAPAKLIRSGSAATEPDDTHTQPTPP